MQNLRVVYTCALQLRVSILVLSSNDGMYAVSLTHEKQLIPPRVSAGLSSTEFGNPSRQGSDIVRPGKAHRGKHHVLQEFEIVQLDAVDQAVVGGIEQAQVKGL